MPSIFHAETVSRRHRIIGSRCPPQLERSRFLGDEVGGHLVSGHVDGVGKSSKPPRRRFDEIVISVPPALAPMVPCEGLRLRSMAFQ